MHDLHNNCRVLPVVSPAAIGANGTKSGKVIDRQGYGGVEFIATYGAIVTSGTIVTLVCKDGDATGSLTSVADANLLGTEALASRLAGATTSGVGAKVSKRLGYKGNKRYVTVDAVQTGTTSVGVVCVEALLHSPHHAPTANP